MGDAPRGQLIFLHIEAVAQYPLFLIPDLVRRSPFYQSPTVPETWEAHEYVTDAGNHRVQYFKLAGTFAGKFGIYGSGSQDQFRKLVETSRIHQKIAPLYSMSWGIVCLLVGSWVKAA